MKPSMELKEGDRQVLYNRFHAMKNRAKDKGIPFAWDEKNGFEEFYLAMKRNMPEDYGLSTYQIRFRQPELHPGGKGYCEETMFFHAYHSGGMVTRRVNTAKSHKKALMKQEDVDKLCVVASALTLVLLEEEGRADYLIRRALEEAGTATKVFNPSQ